jgi:bacterioferritin-associated ferredoxin
MKQTTNVSSGYLCHCLKITAESYEQMIDALPDATFPKLKAAHGIGSLCSSCEYEAKGVLQEYLVLHPAKAAPVTAAPIPIRPKGLRGAFKQVLGRIKKRIRPARTTRSAVVPKPATKIYHTGIFFMRRDGLESRLVVSNLAFPEHSQNVNGASTRFRATLFGDDGTQLAASRHIEVPDGATLELSPADLFPDVRGDFTGGLYVDYESLVQTGSLRPYGVMVSTSPDFRARCHYHDKFALFHDPGYFQNTSPFEPGQTCWMALANCQPLPYETDAFVKIGGEQLRAHLAVGPMSSVWLKLDDLFPDFAAVPADKRSPALFWLENPQHVMLYFFWFNAASGTWMGQHH